MKATFSIRMLAALVAAMLSLGSGGWAGPEAATYYVAPDGDDARDGQAPERAWRTLERVNAAPLAPGGKVLFRRGGEWRGQLVPQSGDESGAVTYGAYGEGAKPALIGSVALNQPSDWKPAGPELWLATGPAPKGGDVLGGQTLRRWALHCEQGAAAQGKLAGGEYRLRCEKAGKSGSQMQLFLSPFRLEAGKTYLLKLRARASQPMKLQAPQMMKSGAPWTGYATDSARATFAIGNEWGECEQLYQAAKSAKDARLTFYLGGALPAGAELTLTDLALFECEGSDRMPCDVGNIIFDEGKAWGWKKWSTAALANDLDYYYDGQAHAVTLRSKENPARRFRSVELALRRHIIDESSRHHVTYEDLALRYGAAHGIGGGSTHHITARGLDISWIGGGHQHTRPDGKPVRFGNGVEFWGNAHDCLVEGCRVWEVYDAALTNQNQGSVVKQENITYRDNVIWNSEYSFEFWNRPEASESRNIVFEHNTCYGAGFGWGHAQRPDQAGRHLCFYTNDAQTVGLSIHDNIFCAAANWAFDANWWKPETVADKGVIRLERNCWFQPEGVMIRFKGKSYEQAQFADYQRETGQDAGSLAADPKFVDAGQRDFRLRPDSPCPGAGARDVKQ